MIRPATDADTEGFVGLKGEIPNREVVLERLESQHRGQRRWLVCQEGGRILGYAYVLLGKAHQHLRH